MSRRPLRIATTLQLESSVRAAGFETFLLPDLPTSDFNRSLTQRLADGEIYRPFLEQHDIELVIDFNTAALTLVRSGELEGEVCLTTAAMGIPYVAIYLDPVTSTMAQVSWAVHWQLLESPTWIKAVWEKVYAEELIELGVPNVMVLPMAITDGDYDTAPPPQRTDGPAVAFMGHPASTWFRSAQSVLPHQLFAGLTAAAVRADMPDIPFHRIHFDLHEFAERPKPEDTFAIRAEKTANYFSQKFVYNAYLAIKQRDRFVRFLKNKLGDTFELIGDHWESVYGLAHTPRIWDMEELHRRMREVPVCLNLHKGCTEWGLNMRHFEITAFGGFMLTYPMPELPLYFEVGSECDVFRNEAELLEKIYYYLAHPAERQEIAMAGQRRTLANHLYSHRIVQLVDTLRKGGVLPGGEAVPPTSSATVVREAQLDRAESAI